MKCSAEVEDVEDCSYLLEVTMAVNPKIIMMIAQAAKSHKVREVVLHVVFYSLGIILFIFTAFIALISGLLAIVQNNNLRNHWNYYRTSISELFNGIESDINTNVKDEVYDFMPEFSVNLSKATKPTTLTAALSFCTTMMRYLVPKILCSTTQDSSVP